MDKDKVLVALDKLDIFREQVQASLREAKLAAGKRASQRDLAQALGLSATELSFRLNGAGKHPLTTADIQAIVLQLIVWSALQTRVQVHQLLELIECPDFTPKQWHAAPLVGLASASQPSGTVASADERASSLATFHKRVAELCRRSLPYDDARYATQRDLANAIGLSEKELNRRLNGKARTPLSERDTHAIVRTFAEWGALTTRAEAEALLRLVGVASFSPGEWASAPLDLLADELAPTNPNNLPRTLTSFIGRETAASKVVQLLARHPLVTITGTGGLGKTRLSLELANKLLPDNRDGVYFVPLAQVSDPAFVPQAVASALGLHDQSGKDLTVLLTSSIASKRMLLVLDNCEHLVNAAADLSYRLLTACPRLRLLATSREKLGVEGEALYPLDILQLPEAETASLATLLQNEAATLFITRAQAVRPDFQITRQNAAILSKLCRLLEGIPLAIELAAPLINALTLDQIFTRLSEHRALLTSIERHRPARHRTLIASISWSYDLLNDAEKLLFQRLSVFRGGWTLEASEAITSDDFRLPTSDFRFNDTAQPSMPVATSDAATSTNSKLQTPNSNLQSDMVLPTLASLVSKSLVNAQPVGSEMRYQMLETVREYALSRLLEQISSSRLDMQPAVRDYAAAKLSQSNEEAAVRQRHLDYYQALAAQAELGLRGAQHGEWQVALEREHDNLRAALDYVLLSGRIEQGMSLAASLRQFWRSHVDEGRRWLEALLGRSDSQPSKAKAEVLLEAARLNYNQGNSESAKQLYGEALTLGRQLADEATLSFILSGVAFVTENAGDHDSARTMFEESIQLARTSGRRDLLVSALYDLAGLVAEQDDYEYASQLYQETLALCYELGDTYHVAYSLSGLAWLNLNRGDYAAALHYAEEGLSLARTLNDTYSTSHALLMVGMVLNYQSDYANARKLLEEALAMLRASGNMISTAQTLDTLAEIAYRQGRHHDATQLYHDTLAITAPSGIKMAIVSSLHGLGLLAAAQGMDERAAYLLAHAAAIRKATSNTLATHKQQEYEIAITNLAERMGEATFAQSSSKGETASIADATAFALTD